MILDKKGKLFGKVSIVDIAILLLVVALAVIFVVRVVKPVNVFSSKAVKCEYTVTVKNIRIESVDALKKSIGQPVLDSQKAKMGKVKEVAEIRPAEGFLQKTDGTMVKSDQPDRFDVDILIEADATKANSGVLIEGKKEISKGSSISLEMPGIGVESQITKIEVK